MRTLLVDAVESVEMDPDGSQFRAVVVENMPMGLPPKRTVLVFKRSCVMQGWRLTLAALAENAVGEPTVENIVDFQSAARLMLRHG